MPRPKPHPESERHRVTISLRRSVYQMASDYMAGNPLEPQDISGLCTNALIEYAEKRYPGIHAQHVAAIRAEAQKEESAPPKKRRRESIPGEDDLRKTSAALGLINSRNEPIRTRNDASHSKRQTGRS